MIDSQISTAVEVIAASLKVKPEDTITGANLGEHIKKVVPSLNLRQVMSIPVGPGALTKFVDRYLGSVLTKVGNSGSDLVYSIAKNAGTGHQAGSNLWSTFARPSAELKIALDISNGLDRAEISVGERLLPNQVSIQSATHSELDNIRTDFTKIVNGSNAQAHLDAEIPYAEWSKKVKAFGAGRYREWVNYRITQIVELFHKRLADLNVPLERSKILEDQLKRSQNALRRNVASHEEGRLERGESPAPRVDAGEHAEGLRSVVMRAVAQLDDSELRQLKLPVGTVFDALMASFKSR